MFKFFLLLRRFIFYQHNIITPNWPIPNNIKSLVYLKNNDIIKDLKRNKNNIFWLNQIHSINILEANLNDNILNIPDADGSYTRQKNLICIIKTADCLPILVSNKSGNFVAAIHAGWRGLANGIIANFFSLINKLNLDLQELLFWFGPAIGPNCFEVGPDVIVAFKYLNPNLYDAAFTKKANTNKYLANIYQLAIIGLNYYNINNHQIFVNNTWCTYSQSDLFYSYRREPNNHNRIYSLIWIN